MFLQVVFYPIKVVLRPYKSRFKPYKSRFKPYKSRFNAYKPLKIKEFGARKECKEEERLKRKQNSVVRKILLKIIVFEFKNTKLFNNLIFLTYKSLLKRFVL